MMNFLTELIDDCHLNRVAGFNHRSKTAGLIPKCRHEFGLMRKERASPIAKPRFGVVLGPLDPPKKL